MDVIRVGNKLLSMKKINRTIEKILELRVQGYSQQEIGGRLNVDRTFISRLEKLGEIRRGKRVAVIGFPIANRDELYRCLVDLGVEYILLFTDKERWQFVRGSDGLELFNSVMRIITELRSYDTVIVIASNYRIKLCEALLDKEVVGYEIGRSPIEGDKDVSIEAVEEIVSSVIGNK